MYRVVVIDDDVDAMNNLVKSFPWEESDFTVTASFQDGQSALDYLKYNQVDLIISDIKMAGINGIELARQLSKMHRGERIIFISGYKDFEYARKALEYGVRSYCIKPVTFREIQEKLAIIHQELDRERQETGGAPLPAAQEQNSLADVLIGRIKRYIERHYLDVSLVQLADYMDMNPSYLSRFFKEKTGTKLFDYITDVRLHAAMDMLKNGHLPVSEVGERVGYTNAISFTRSFKRMFGVSPSEYRRRFDSVEESK